MKKTKYFSWKCGELAKGCRLCVEGQKLVLFITGICSQKCFYCPISEKKYWKDVVYANEWKIEDPENPKELIEEAGLTDAKGAGITGGDPLAKVDRCVKYIHLLKNTFGKEFHIHLYAPLKFVTTENLKMLHEAGLDEIRFHPDLDDRALWNRIGFAKQFKWDIGIEIPAIPCYEQKIKELVDYIANKVNFLNLNELEVSDTQTSHYRLGEMGFKPKDELSYGVKGSEETAMEALKHAEIKGMNVHYCTAKLKDRVQVRNRIIRRAKHIALHFDKITEEGLLIRGCIYLPEAMPRNNKAIDQKIVEKIVEQLKTKYNVVLEKLRLSKKDCVIDNSKLRILVSGKTIQKKADIIKKLGLVPAIVEEYPTRDAIEVNIDFL